MKHFNYLKLVYTLLSLLTLSMSSLSAATVESVKNGDWNSGTTWSTGAVPGPNDDVVIKHLVGMTGLTADISMGKLTINAGGRLNLFSRSVTIKGQVNVYGKFYDLDGGGNNNFKQKVTIHPGGIWDTGNIKGSFLKMLFEGGIEHNGTSMILQGLSMGSRNQDISGSSIITITHELYVGAGITVTNKNTASLLFDESVLKGENTTAKFINEGILDYRTSQPPMLDGTVDFSKTGNTVIYGRLEKQRIRTATYFNLIITDDNPNTSKTKSLDPGTTRVLNEFIVEPNGDFSPEDKDLVVIGEAKVHGIIYDGYAVGSCTFNNLDLSGGTIHGAPWGFGTYLINGDLIINTADAYLKEASINVLGNTIIPSGRTLYVSGKGESEKQFKNLRVEAGGALIDDGQNGKIRIIEKFENQGATVFKQAVHFHDGFNNTGDTLGVKTMVFDGHNQEFTSADTIYIDENIIVASGVEATNKVSGGLIFKKERTVVGEDATAKFINSGKMVMFGNELPAGIRDVVDFTGENGELELYMEPKPYVELPKGPFYHLSIRNSSTTNTLYLFPPFQTLQTGGDLSLYHNINLNPVGLSLEIGGTLRVVGSEIFDNDLAGSITTGGLEIKDALLDGRDWRHGNITVNGDFDVWGECTEEEGSLIITGMTTIHENSSLTLVSKEGDLNFGGLTILEGGEFIDGTLGENFNFEGPVYLNGSLGLSNGTINFTESLVIDTAGLLSFTKEWGTYSFKNGIINHGDFLLGNGTFDVAGEVGGTAEINLASNLTIAAGDTLINTNTAGFTLGGVLNGESEDSYFINKGVLNYSSRTPNVPMENGVIDVFTYPENTINFNGTGGWQEVPAGNYRNVGFRNGGNKKLVGKDIDGDGTKEGDIFIYGNIEIKDCVLRKNSDPFSVGVVQLVGDGDQLLNGYLTGAVEELFVEKSGGSVKVKSDFGITGTMLMKAGIVEAYEGGIALSGNAFLQEAENSYIIGKVAAEREIKAGGSNDFGGLGLKIQAGSGVVMGPTRVIRHTGAAFEPGQIERYYEVLPTNNENLNATIELSYLEKELSGAIEADLGVVHKLGDGEFERLGGRVLTKSNAVRKAKINSFGILSLTPISMAVTAYPSPLYDGNLTIEYVVSEEQYVDIRVMDRAGRTFVKDHILAQAGKNLYELSELNLAAGVYFVRIAGTEKTGYRQIVKITP